MTLCVRKMCEHFMVVVRYEQEFLVGEKYKGIYQQIGPFFVMDG